MGPLVFTVHKTCFLPWNRNCYRQKGGKSVVKIDASGFSNSFSSKTTASNFSVKVSIDGVILLNDFWLEQSLILFLRFEIWMGQKCERVLLYLLLSRFLNSDLQSYRLDLSHQNIHRQLSSFRNGFYFNESFVVCSINISWSALTAKSQCDCASCYLQYLYFPKHILC